MLRQLFPILLRNITARAIAAPSTIRLYRLLRTMLLPYRRAALLHRRSRGPALPTYFATTRLCVPCFIYRFGGSGSNYTHRSQTIFSRTWRTYTTNVWTVAVFTPYAPLLRRQRLTPYCYSNVYQHSNASNALAPPALHGDAAALSNNGDAHARCSIRLTYLLSPLCILFSASYLTSPYSLLLL